jgi:phosphoribosylformimino-5-aminoimidazole carboxamide ribotide isomerase
VRLYKGDFDKVTIFNSSPYNQALKFQKEGFDYLHLVDLDGALQGKQKNKDIIIKILKKTNLKVQLGGGIRNLDQITFWLNHGVSTVVLGTMAIKNLKSLEKACNLYPGRIAVALDVRDGFLSINGWIKQTKIKFLDFSKKLEKLGVSKIIYTDINRDGTKLGVNISQIKKIKNKVKIPLIVSGGFSSIEDVKKIFALKKLYGIILGRAIYDGSIKIQDLIKISG